MLYFNVIRNIIATDCYYYFRRNNEIIYEGYELPGHNNYLILEISGGEDGHGCCLYFDVA